MIRNRFIFLFSIALIISAFSSCNNKIITVSPEAVVLGADGAGKYLTVDAPGDWVATSSADWLKLGMSSGKEGVSSVYVYADKTTSVRSAVLTFSSMGNSSMVSVSQSDGSASQGGGEQGGEQGGGGGTAVAGTYSFDFNAMGYSDQAEVPTVSKDGITISFEKGQASTPAKWFSVSDGVGGVRVYAKSSFTVASSKKITKIEFVFGTETQDKSGITSSPAGYSEPTWTGSAGSVTFTVDSEGKHRRIAKITVTLSSDDSGVNPGGGGGEQGGGQGGQGGQGGEQGGGSGSGSFTDVLNAAFTGASSNTYIDWSGKKGSASAAVYAGNNASQYGAIQLRSKNDNSGIVSTTSGGKLSKIVLTWNSKSGEVGNTAARAVQVYGSTTAYSSPSDLYNSSKQGTLLGTITYGQGTELSVSGNYSYVGLRSKENALYLDEIKITWTK